MKITSTHSFPGSTVIEVLIATTLIAFALTGLAMLMTANVKNSSEADYREAAIGLAQDAMEQIKQNKTTKLWSDFTGGTNAANSYASSSCNGVAIVKYNTNFKVLCWSKLEANKLTATIETCWDYTTEPPPKTSTPLCPAASKSTRIVQTFYNY